mmetsp:Transcript_1871/g.5145  ORF Transcript_1871/g.5145 Transcript_1871/m.5145 type:complete len:160 (-) Transcript_1871:859-1338(-)
MHTLIHAYAQLRRIHHACFPIHYQKSFYDTIVQRKDDGFCKFASVNGKIVGAVCCRVETPAKRHANKDAHVYIMTLGVLAPYRSRGIGSQLLQSVLDHCELHRDGTYGKLRSIRLHVQVSNEDAIDFYTQRFDFTKGGLVRNYYRRLEPPDCYVLEKKF